MERGRNRRPTKIGDGATQTGAARRPVHIRRYAHRSAVGAKLGQVHGQTPRKSRLHPALQPIPSSSGRLRAASVPITRVARCSRKCLIWCGESKVRALRAAAVCGARSGVTSRYARAPTRARLMLNGVCGVREVRADARNFGGSDDSATPHISASTIRITTHIQYGMTSNMAGPLRWVGLIDV